MIVEQTPPTFYDLKNAVVITVRVLGDAGDFFTFGKFRKVQSVTGNLEY